MTSFSIYTPVISRVLAVSNDVLLGSGSAAHSNRELLACREASFALSQKLVLRIGTPEFTPELRQVTRSITTAAETLHALQINEDGTPVPRLFAETFGEFGPVAVAAITSLYQSVMQNLEPEIAQIQAKIEAIQHRKAARAERRAERTK